MELNPWHKRQAALIHHFTSMEYLKALLPQIDSLLALTDQMLDERSHLDAAGRALAGWSSQNTASHFSTYAYPALMEFRQGIVKDIALRSITGGHGELCPAMTLNDVGRAALKEVGRDGLWGDTEALYRFLDANRHLDPYGWSDVQPDLAKLAPSQIAVSAFDFQDCEWHFVEPVPDEFEDIDGSYIGTD